MAIRAFPLGIGLLAALCLAACDGAESGPIVVSAIGGAPERINPNLKRVDAATAILLESTAQGLVRFNAEGQIEPALAQSWIVSDDGLRYTFRLARGAKWANGQDVTAEQVVARLKATMSRASSNALKPLLGVIDDIESMTDDVLEISLKAPRAHFLQLLAQPDMAILQSEKGTGPFQAEATENGAVLLAPIPEEEGEETREPTRSVLLRGEEAAKAVARFEAGGADLVTGGTIASLPYARSARLPANTLRFDPAHGLLGLAFTRLEGRWADAGAREALSMALDRGAIATALQVPELRARPTLLPAGLEEVRQPALPLWASQPLDGRRARASQALANGEADPPIIRVAVPDTPGHRFLFALIRRDWRAIGVDAVAVESGATSDLAFIDEVSPITGASWYLRRFSCEIQPVCDPEIDALLADARQTRSIAERMRFFAEADRRLTDASYYIPIGSPVRWSLVSGRLSGFRTNVFAQHPLGELIAE
ncbi:ABC transporter substrate-binding protein [Allosphingosinicella flava]|uniref:ABC transporter substrate-binding protein n=1 Tax=Allosphingosinicella flava TaxID=2771430 RepID=A0A7T2GK07_9SPHN|nr:ABC transporter substrate-binding protein [Sphingosinicella flava]QPQ55202.1 ABC transporter substrate-binding protein [Sphingosinicella flava]